MAPGMEHRQDCFAKEKCPTGLESNDHLLRGNDISFAQVEGSDRLSPGSSLAPVEGAWQRRADVSPQVTGTQPFLRKPYPDIRHIVRAD